MGASTFFAKTYRFTYEMTIISRANTYQVRSSRWEDFTCVMIVRCVDCDARNLAPRKHAFTCVFIVNIARNNVRIETPMDGL